MLQILLQAMGRVRARHLALFPRLSTASASRDVAQALAAGSLNAQGERALTRYRFR
jgi:hypothetical protein